MNEIKKKVDEDLQIDSSAIDDDKVEALSKRLMFYNQNGGFLGESYSVSQNKTSLRE